VVGEGGGGRGEEEDEGGSPFEVVDATTTMEVQCILVPGTQELRDMA